MFYVLSSGPSLFCCTSREVTCEAQTPFLSTLCKREIGACVLRISGYFACCFTLQVRQRGVVRKPAHVHNYVHNAQMVVDALAGPILNMDLSHITGEAIVRGDTVAIR